MKKGNDIVIFEGSTAIAGTRDYTLNQQMDVTENSSPSSSQARTYQADYFSWDVTVTRLLTAFRNTVLHVGSTYTMAFRDRHDVGDYVTGTVLCFEAQVEGTEGNLARGTWRFRGQGSMTIPEVGDFNNDFNIDFLIS